MDTKDSAQSRTEEDFQRKYSGTLCYFEKLSKSNKKFIKEKISNLYLLGKDEELKYIIDIFESLHSFVPRNNSEESPYNTRITHSPEKSSRAMKYFEELNTYQKLGEVIISILKLMDLKEKLLLHEIRK